MGNILIKEKEIVVPGEDLAEGMDILPGEGCYRDENKIVASKLGLAKISGRLIKIIPLSGKYMPKTDDVVIGKITEILMMGWRVDINCAYPSMLSLRDASSEYIAKGADLSKFFRIGDYVVAKITQVTSQKLIDLSAKGPGLYKLNGGRIIYVKPTKIPRIIGKAGSMVNLIKEKTGAKITAGQNGVVWIQADPKMELIVVEAIRMIEQKAHTDGLTDKVKEFLDKAVKGGN